MVLPPLYSDCRPGAIRFLDKSLFFQLLQGIFDGAVYGWRIPANFGLEVGK
jgi:hypothetical protein